MNTPTYYATGLRLGLIEPSNIQLWVNDQINEAAAPSETLIQHAYVKESDVHLAVLVDGTLTSSRLSPHYQRAANKKLQSDNLTAAWNAAMLTTLLTTHTAVNCR